MLKLALSTNENHILRLYSNAYTPISSAALGSFTESAFTNYAARTMTRANWNSAVTVAGKGETSYNAVQSWTCGTTGGTVTGYYVVGSAGTLLWAEAFSTARVLSSGDILNITPKFTLSSES
jgi:hypothetical protein